MGKKTRMAWVGGNRMEDNWQCVKCGHRFSTPKADHGGRTGKPERCPSCKTRSK